MKFFVLAGALFVASSASASTDFGVRTVGSISPFSAQEARPAAAVNLQSAAQIAATFGRVTSLRRSPEHNRRVGGVRNSYHLSGRAIDIARRSGVSHQSIASALRNAGFQLIESLDEGDHSHFAFGASKRSSIVSRSKVEGDFTSWRVVYAPR